MNSSQTDQYSRQCYLFRLLTVVGMNMCLWVTSLMMTPPVAHVASAQWIEGGLQEVVENFYTPLVRVARQGEAGSLSFSTLKDSFLLYVFLASIVFLFSVVIGLGSKLVGMAEQDIKTMQHQPILLEEDSSTTCSIIREEIFDVSLEESECSEEESAESVESSQEEINVDEQEEIEQSIDCAETELFDTKSEEPKQVISPVSDIQHAFLEFGKSFLSPEFLKELFEDNPNTTEISDEHERQMAAIPSPPQSEGSPPPGFLRPQETKVIKPACDVRDWRANDKPPSLSNNRTLNAFRNLNASRKIPHHFFPDPHSVSKSR